MPENDEALDETTGETGGEGAAQEPDVTKLTTEELLAKAGETNPVMAELAKRLHAQAANQPTGGAEIAAFVASLPERVRSNAFGKDAQAACKRLEQSADVIRRGFKSRNENPPTDLLQRAFRAEFGMTTEALADVLGRRAQHSVAAGGRATDDDDAKDPKVRAIKAVAKKMAELGM